MEGSDIHEANQFSCMNKILYLPALMDWFHLLGKIFLGPSYIFSCMPIIYQCSFLKGKDAQLQAFIYCNIYSCISLPLKSTD